MTKTITARVRLTVDVPVSDTWGMNCSMQQVSDQAKESAIGMLRRSMHRSDFTIVGDPKVTMVSVEEE